MEKLRLYIEEFGYVPDRGTDLVPPMLAALERARDAKGNVKLFFRSVVTTRYAMHSKPRIFMSAIPIRARTRPILTANLPFCLKTAKI